MKKRNAILLSLGVTIGAASAAAAYFLIRPRRLSIDENTESPIRIVDSSIHFYWNDPKDNDFSFTANQSVYIAKYAKFYIGLIETRPQGTYPPLEPKEDEEWTLTIIGKSGRTITLEHSGGDSEQRSTLTLTFPSRPSREKQHLYLKDFIVDYISLATGEGKPTRLPGPPWDIILWHKKQAT